MTYPGVIYFKDQNKALIDIELENRQIHFALNDTKSSYQVDEFTPSIGGANNHLLFLTHPDFVIQIPLESNILVRLKSNSSQFIEFAKKYQKEKNNKKIIILLLCLLVAGFLVGGVKMLRGGAVLLSQAIPFEQERKLGKFLLQNSLPISKVEMSLEAVGAFKKMVAPLEKVLPVGFTPFEYYFSRDSTVNAFALPGGYIIINTGLLEKAASDEEVLGVIAHEMAHVTKRHVLRQLFQGAGLFVVVQSLLGDLSGIIAVLADQGAFFLNRSYSRDMEREADLEGFRYLVEANIPPIGMVRFFERLLEQEKTMGEIPAALVFLSTHPDTKERIEILREKAKKLGFSTALEKKKSNYLGVIQKEIKK